MPSTPPESHPATTPWPCVTDATTCAGLSALRRHHPRSWHEHMGRASRRVGPEATVAEALRAGGMGELLPTGPTDRDANRLKKRRDCARRLIEAHGGTVLADIDDAWLYSRRRRAPRSPSLGRLSRGRVTACYTLLRRVVHAVQMRAGVPRVKARLAPRPRRPIGDPTERDVAPWPDLERLIESGPARIRAALVLALHVTARTGRVLALRVGDVKLGEGVVTVRVCDRAGRASTLRYPLPPRAVEAVRPWHQIRREKAGDDGRLFPMRGQPDRPTRSLSRAIRRAAKTLGCEPTTLAAVRVRGQAALRAARAPRGMVRGTGRVASKVQARVEARVRDAWEASYGTTREHVPQRAPARCSPNQPEVGRRRAPRAPQDRIDPTPLIGPDTVIRSHPQEDGPAPTSTWPEFEELSRLLGGMAPPPEVVYVPVPAANPPARPQVDLTHALAFGLGLTTREAVGLVVKLVQARVGERSAAEVLADLAAAVGAPVEVPDDEPADEPDDLPDEGGGPAAPAHNPWGWDDAPRPRGEPNHGPLRAVDLLQSLRR